MIRLLLISLAARLVRLATHSWSVDYIGFLVGDDGTIQMTLVQRESLGEAHGAPVLNDTIPLEDIGHAAVNDEEA